MKTFVLTFIGSLFSLQITAQKPSIDFYAIENWHEIGPCSISNDGKYISYFTKSRNLTKQSLTIKSSDRKTVFSLNAAINFQFSENSKYGLFQLNKDSLGIVDLQSKTIKYLENVTSYKENFANNTTWLAYTLKREGSTILKLYNLESNQTFEISNSANYQFSTDDQSIIVQTRNNNFSDSLKTINLLHHKSDVIWPRKGDTVKYDISSVIFNKQGNGIAFLGKSTKSLQIVYYSTMDKKSSILFEQYHSNLPNAFQLSALYRFDYYDKGIFISCTQNKSQKTQNSLGLKIWKYSDETIISENTEALIPPFFNAYITLTKSRLIVLNTPEEDINLNNPTKNDSLFILTKNSGPTTEYNWNKYVTREYEMVNCQTGERTPIKPNGLTLTPTSCSISPNCNYLVFHDRTSNSYYSQNLHNGKLSTITSGIKTNWLQQNDIDQENSSMTYPIAGYVKNEDAILLYDEYDIWKVYLDRKQSPLNLTNGYGRKTKTEFRLLPTYNDSEINLNEELKLLAFNTKSKENGFYNTQFKSRQDPQVLLMGPYVFYAPIIRLQAQGTPPIKAKATNKYLLYRMSSNESTNIFLTSDFKAFDKMTDFSLENNYNWLSTELHNWKGEDGNQLQGILYKPENFDSTKQYPVIITYYEKISDLLNVFIVPDYSNGMVNIPYYVSNGYLVFAPDIHYKFGDPGPGFNALSAVVSATNHLSTLSFVNTRKLGLQGWSFGGYETNFIIGNSNLFAAAVSSSAPTNLTSLYLSLFPDNGKSFQGFLEVGQFRLKNDLWSNPKLYINNSPIFYAHKVATPLMLMHTTTDFAVPMSQAIEFYLSLRRLGKPVWLLEYGGNNNHGVYGEASVDFTIRMTEFFNYYLKDSSAPAWMEISKGSILK